MTEYHRVHIVGVAGVGMSALAQAALGAGAAVSGSDRYLDRGEMLPVLAQLVQAGVKLHPQNGEGVRAGVDAVAVSTAIEPDNPDLLAARAAGVPVLHRSRLLASLVRGRRCLAVSGTSGKSTVTGMAGWILEQAGRNPTVVNGAPVINWQSASAVGNYRCGSGDLWLIEADESDRSLLNFTPQHGVITNISADHFDLAETRRLFEAFRVQVAGTCIGALESATTPTCMDVHISAEGSRFVLDGVDFQLRLPGRHNVENARHAVMLCGCEGVATVTCAVALRTFRGIHRRLEVAGCARGVTVVDDYAHNPAKLSAALAATVPFARRGIVIWRPHGYGPLRAMLDDLVCEFRVLRGGGHRLLLLPVYDAGGTADRSIGSETLAARLQAEGVDVRCVPDFESARKEAVAVARPGDVVLVAGARDPGLPGLARSVAAALA